MTTVYCVRGCPLPPLPDGTFLCPLCFSAVVRNAPGGHGTELVERDAAFLRAVAAVDAKFPVAMSRLAGPTPE